MELKGRIKQILPPETGEGRNGTWTKQTFILTTPGEYPKDVAIQVWGDKATIRAVGAEVVVYINIESREYNGKYYTDVKAWKILGGEIMAAAAQKPPEKPEVGPDDDQIPF